MTSPQPLSPSNLTEPSQELEATARCRDETWSAFVLFVMTAAITREALAAGRCRRCMYPQIVSRGGGSKTLILDSELDRQKKLQLVSGQWSCGASAWTRSHISSLLQWIRMLTRQITLDFPANVHSQRGTEAYRVFAVVQHRARQDRHRYCFSTGDDPYDHRRELQSNRRRGH